VLQANLSFRIFTITVSISSPQHPWRFLQSTNDQHELHCRRVLLHLPCHFLQLSKRFPAHRFEATGTLCSYSTKVNRSVQHLCKCSKLVIDLEKLNRSSKIVFMNKDEEKSEFCRIYYQFRQSVIAFSISSVFPSSG
jgi:hypothetical protein